MKNNYIKPQRPCNVNLKCIQLQSFNRVYVRSIMAYMQAHHLLSVWTENISVRLQ